jgi:hypothetical protein
MSSDPLVGLLALIGIGIVVYGPWQRLWSDFARQVLFEVRDEIFDLAAQNRLSFDSYEYRTLRDSLEKTIRYAHDLTLPRFIYHIFVHRLISRPRSSNLKTAVNAIADADVRELVRRRVTYALTVAMAVVFVKSLLFMILGAPVLIVGIAIHAVTEKISMASLTGGLRDLIQRDAEAQEPDGRVV